MDIDKIIQELNRRFAEPLPEYYKRRIIVWHDEEREFEDRLSEIVLTNAKTAVLTGSNNFAVKKLLCADDTLNNYLLYCPISYESQEDNWFLDIELYGEEFRADMVSMWMDEIGIPHTPSLLKEIKVYRKFFNAKERRSRISQPSIVPANPAQLQLAVMAALSGLTNARPDNIIKAVLKGGLSEESNKIYQELVNYEIDKAFWRMAAQGTGYNANVDETGLPDDGKVNIGGFAAHILLTALTRTMQQEFLTGTKNFISAAHQPYCYDLVSDWLHSDDVQSIYEIAEYVEDEMRLPQLFMKLYVDDLVDSEIFPCIDEVILIKLMKDIGDHNENMELISRTVEKRRICVWYDKVKYFYEGIMQVSNMQSFLNKYASGFHIVEPKKIWKEYTSDYYIMDTYYRKFHVSYAESLKMYTSALSDFFTSVMERVEYMYMDFLEQLGDNWSDSCADNLCEYGKILDVPQQTDFYSDKVARSDSKIYVIISDAMRYEVAVSLAEQLRRETQSKVGIDSMQGIFPTITKFGMAALLPHEKLWVELKNGKNERLTVLADGQSTEANNRDKVLKNTDIKSVALKYKDIIGVKRAERQALVKGMNIVYIYHDSIDEAGHMNKSVFTACDEAIDELKNVVRIITNDFGGTNILITSDHGFLYTYSPLNEDDKVDKTTESDQDVEIGRRYAIMKKDAKPEYLLPVKFLKGDTDYNAFTPRENVRIKLKGSSLNFVHGGISLQEIVVPVINYHFLRNDSKEYKRNKNKYDTKAVTIGILSSSRKISNMIFSLNFYQKEAVTANREAAVYQLYFINSFGKKISDTVRIIADKTDENAQNRMFRCNFNLKSLKYSNTEIYYLIISDENGLEISREEFQIDIAFAVDEFNFFN